MKNLVILCCLVSACASAGRVTLSYHAIVDRGASDQAWSRACAYMGRHSLAQNEAITFRGENLVLCGGTLITREYDAQQVVIRASRSITLPPHPEDKIPPEIRKILVDERDRLKGILDYVKTGKSLFMKDLDIPLKYESK